MTDLAPTPALGASGNGLPPRSATRPSRAVGWLPTWALISTKNLELRKRWGLIVAAVALTVGLVVVVLGFRLLAHGLDPKSFGPAGSLSLFSDLMSILAEFGYIVAVALGASAGTTDLTDGMFRHLVITGRSRLALYLAQLPAGLVILLPLVAVAFAMLCLVTAYEGTAPALAVNEMIKAGLWLELEVCIGFVVGVGLGSLIGQRTVPIVVLIVLQIIITPILADHVIPYFINGQRLFVGVAMDQLRPAALGAGLGRGPLVGGGALRIPPMPTWAMTTVVAGWIVGWTLIGAWKMTTRDA